MKRCRLLYVANVSWFFVSHRLAHGEAARKSGYDVHVATRVTSAADRARIEDCGLTLHEIPMGRGDTSLWYDLRSLFATLRAIRSLKPDFVHLVGMKPLILGGLASRLLRVPYLVVAIPGLGTAFSATGARARIRQTVVLALMRLSLRRKHIRLIFQNRSDMTTLVEHGVATKDHSRLIRGSGVAMSGIVPTPEPAEPVKILLAARMLRSKGVEVFAEAARLLEARYPHVEFLLAGDIDATNPDSLRQDQLNALASRANLRWLGHVGDMDALLRSIHIMCLPTYYGEGVPRVLIEAAALGRPIVTTRIAGCDDICIDEVNGLLVPPRDTKALANALIRLIENPFERQSFGRAGRQRAETEFSLELVTKQILAVYDEFEAQCSRQD